MRKKDIYKFRKTDVIIPFAALLFSILIYGFYAVTAFGSEGSFITVTVAGESYGRYPLSEELDIIIPGDKGLNNRLIIKDGKAKVIAADCPDRLCVHQKSISKSNETIVCLPNKVVIAVEGGEEGDIDAVSR